MRDGRGMRRHRNGDDREGDAENEEHAKNGPQDNSHRRFSAVRIAAGLRRDLLLRFEAQVECEGPRDPAEDRRDPYPHGRRCRAVLLERRLTVALRRVPDLRGIAWGRLSGLSLLGSPSGRLVHRFAPSARFRNTTVCEKQTPRRFKLAARLLLGAPGPRTSLGPGLRTPRRSDPSTVPPNRFP